MRVHDKGQHFEQLLNRIIAFSCLILSLQISFSVTVTRLRAHSSVSVRRSSIEARETFKNTFSHLIVINIVDINIIILKLIFNHSIANVRKEFQV